MRSLKVRLLLTVLGAITAGFVLAGAIGGRFVANSIGREFDARLERMAEALASAADIRPNGELELSQALDDGDFGQLRSGWYWMIASQEHVLARSRSLWTERLAVEGREIGRSYLLKGPNGEDLRAFLHTTSLGGRSSTLTITVAAPARIVDEEIRGVVGWLVALLAIIGIASAVSVAVLVDRGLAPLDRVAGAVNRIARGEIETIVLTGYREIDPLVGAVNGLLGHAREVVERSRLQASHLAHALKTPLSLIATRVRTVVPNERVLIDNVDKIGHQIDRHLKRARLASTATLTASAVQIRPVIDDILLVMERTYRDRSIKVATHVEDGASFLGEREDLEELLGNLIENAFKWARMQIAIYVVRSAGRVIVSVCDDGPGLDQAAQEAVLRPGVRLDETVAGSGFGLTIVAELVRRYGGTLNLGRSPWAGLKASVELAEPSNGIVPVTTSEGAHNEAKRERQTKQSA